MTFAHRFRRKDQNELLGYPLDRWGPWYHFSSEDVARRNARFQSLGYGWEVQLETGEVLWEHSKEVRRMKLTKAGGKEIPKRAEGSRDPYMPGRILVPLGRIHHALRKVTGAPPETFYRYNEKRNRVECMVSVMPDGLAVAWDTCGLCAQHIKACGCRAMQPPRSVIHFYELATGAPFEKPKYEVKVPVFERKKELPRRSKLVDKESPIGSSLNGLQKAKIPLTKSRPKVALTKETRLSDFDTDASSASESSKAKLLKSLKPKLTKG